MGSQSSSAAEDPNGELAPPLGAAGCDGEPNGEAPGEAPGDVEAPPREDDDEDDPNGFDAPGVEAPPDFVDVAPDLLPVPLVPEDLLSGLKTNCQSR